MSRIEAVAPDSISIIIMREMTAEHGDAAQSPSADDSGAAAALQTRSMARRPRLALLLAACVLLLAQMGVVNAERRTLQELSTRPHHPYPTRAAQGCALCRGTGNCSRAVENEYEGVYCGDLIATFQPCCCQFRNECMTTIFSERCDCLTDEQVEEFMSARFTIFCVFTVVMWVALIYDRMCMRPYKVMNSNRHHMLADSPSVARLHGAAPRETAQDQELLEIDDSDVTATSESAEERQSPADAAPQQPDEEKPSVEETPDAALGEKQPDVVLNVQSASPASCHGGADSQSV